MPDPDDVRRGAPVDHSDWETDTESGDAAETGEDTDAGPDRVAARDSDAVRFSRFEHKGIVCELGGDDGVLYGFVKLPPGVDHLHLLWEVDPPGRFSYGPDDDGWIGFDTTEADDASPREVGVALAGLAVQVAERARSDPD